MDDQRLERALRQRPPFSTGYVPASLTLDERPVIRGPVSVGRLVVIIAVTVLLLVALLAGLAAVGALRNGARPVSNGWVAFAQASDGFAGHDIYIAREGQPARRIIGSGPDRLDQVCPAFSPDGSRLAYGEAATTYGGVHRDAALVISDLDADGNASESLRIEVGGYPPPCAAWSADGRRVAFGVPLTSPTNPDRTAAGSEVWVASVADGHVEVLPDLLATDLEWSPQGSKLAIASGQTDRGSGNRLHDGSIRLYDADRGEMRTLVGPSGVSMLTWSPDGSRIAYQRGESDGGAGDQEIWVAQIDGSGEHLIASGFGAIRGIGPVWSPTGDRIVYQGCLVACSGETVSQRVVLVTPDGESEAVLPYLTLQPGSAASPPPIWEAPRDAWFPCRVIWSPDGKALLYTAWRRNEAGLRDRKALISRPLERGSDPAALVEDTGISACEGDDAVHGIQSWGRDPDR